VSRGERLDVNTSALIAASSFCPTHKLLHLVAVFPHQVKELIGVQACGFGSEKGLEPPAQVRAVPRIQAITAGHNPVVPQHLPHLANVYSAGTLYFLRAASLPSGLRGAHAREASLHHASPKYQCSGLVFLWSYRLLFFRRNAWRRWSMPAYRAG